MVGMTSVLKFPPYFRYVVRLYFLVPLKLGVVTGSFAQQHVRRDHWLLIPG